MTKDLQEKYEKLKSDLLSMGKAAIAFSGGVDSTFLLRTAFDVLGTNVLAVTARSGLVPDREMEEARSYCEELGVRHLILEQDELAIPGFRENPPDRCYLCKKVFFGKIIAAAREEGITQVAEGSNMDDIGDYRPGMRAIAELHVRSPLQEAGFYKEEIRTISRELGLPTWEKPSYACLASRFAYGEEITREKLRRTDRAEQLLLDLGFRQMRVRTQGTIARIEVPPQQFALMLQEEIRTRISSSLKALGYSYVTMDLDGYRTGSMNEVLKVKPEDDAQSPAPEEDQEETSRNPFSRTELLIGKERMQRLADARVAVFGLGGVGGYVTEALARSGIGTLDLIDSDRICPSNLNRQILATEKTIGRLKTDAARERIREIHPETIVNVYPVFYLPETADRFDFSRYDYIVDAIDTVAGKLMLAQQAYEAGTPIISCMGAGNKMDPAAFRVADIYETSVCPLAKVMRRELKKRGIPSLKVVYSTEKAITPGKPDASEMTEHGSSRRSTPGSNAFVPAAAGLILAGEVVRDLISWSGEA